MRKIANTSQLQSELLQIIAYAQTERPARALIANKLQDLSFRVAGPAIPILDRPLAEAFEAASAALFRLKAKLVEGSKNLTSRGNSFRVAHKLIKQALESVEAAQDNFV